MVSLLKVTNLAVEFSTYGGIVSAVRGVNFELEEGKTLAIVGESGCGKSVTVQSMMGLTPMPPGRLVSGSAQLRGEEILGQRWVQRGHRVLKNHSNFSSPYLLSLNPSLA